MRRLVVGLSVALCAACGPEEAGEVVQLRANGAFSIDGRESLLVETSYRTTKVDEPWYATSSASGWEVRFYRAGPSMESPRLVARFDDVAQQQGGGIQNGPLYWMNGGNRVVCLEYAGVVTWYDLDSGRRRPLEMPRAELERLFGDVADGAALVFAAPSPDEALVAGFLTAAWQDPGNVFDLRFRHAVVVFSASTGDFLRAVELEAFRGSSEDLQLRPPEPRPPTPTHVQVLAGEGTPRFLWQRDSGGVVVVDVTRDDAGDIVSGRALRIDATTLAVTEMNRVPALAVPSPFGPVRPDGVHLVVRHVPGQPNADALALHLTENWVPFADVGEVDVREATYAW